MIRVGDKVKDRITGLEGVVISVTQWLNGCVRAQIQPVEIKDGKPVDTTCFDVEQLDVVTPREQTNIAFPTDERAERFERTVVSKSGGDRDDHAALR